MNFDFLLYNERLFFKKINSNLVENFLKKNEFNVKQYKVRKNIA